MNSTGPCQDGGNQGEKNAMKPPGLFNNTSSTSTGRNSGTGTEQMTARRAMRLPFSKAALCALTSSRIAAQDKTSCWGKAIVVFSSVMSEPA